MPGREPSEEELNRLAAALGGLAPRGGLNRDRLMYLAGQAAAEPSSARIGRWAWPTGTAALVVLSATLTALLVLRQPQVVVRMVYVPAPAAAPIEATTGADVSLPPRSNESPSMRQSRDPLDAAPRDDTPPTLRMIGGPPRLGPQPTYGQLRDAVLTWGVDALPEQTAATGGASSPTAPLGQRELLKALLEEASPHRGDAS